MKIKSWVSSHQYDIIILCLFYLLSLFLLQTSFLHAGSNWWDINAMTEMGRAWLAGRIPFRDLFEQRGPYMYLLMLIANVLDYTTPIHGIYIIELINFTFLYFLTKKVGRLYLSEKRACWTSMATILLLVTAPIFTQGATPEEFCLIPTTYLFYLILRTYKTANWDFTWVEFGLAGAGLGYVFWVKFSIIGIFVAFFVFTGIRLLLKKEIRAFLFELSISLAGFVLASLPIVLYYAMNGALKDLLTGYIGVNMGYGDYHNNPLISIVLVFWVPIYMLSRIIPISVICAPLVVIFFLITKSSKQGWLFILIGLLASWVMPFATQRPSNYYLVDFVFQILVLCCMTAVIVTQTWSERTKVFKKNTLIMTGIPSMIGLLGVVFMCAIAGNPVSEYSAIPNQISSLFIKKDQLVSYQFGQYIKRHGSGKLLVYGFLDDGFYRGAGQLPWTKYWEITLINYISNPKPEDTQVSYITHSIPRWVITQSDGFTGANGNLLTTSSNHSWNLELRMNPHHNEYSLTDLSVHGEKIKSLPLLKSLKRNYRPVKISYFYYDWGGKNLPNNVTYILWERKK